MDRLTAYQRISYATYEAIASTLGYLFKYRTIKNG